MVCTLSECHVVPWRIDNLLLQGFLSIHHRYEDKQTAARSDIRKYNQQLPHILHNRPRPIIRGAIERLNQCHDSANRYGTELDTSTCTCPDFLYRGPYCKHLLSAAIKRNMLPETVYNTLDLQEQG